MTQRILLCAVACTAVLTADTLVLRSGRSVEGTYLGGDSRRVRIAVGEKVESYSVDEISNIHFGSSQTPAATAAAPPPRKRAELLRPSPEPVTAPKSGRSEVPAGTSLVIRMIDDVDSERDSVGQTFRASTDEAVVVNGETVIPRGADVVAKLVADRDAGRLTGRTELTLDLQTVTVNGRPVEVATGEVTQQGESRSRQTATRTGGGAALGAVIGAIAGGGRGAAIGAVTGAAAGGAVQVLTKGQKVRIPSETRLTFTLQNPLTI
jgi:hypothetical protein